MVVVGRTEIHRRFSKYYTEIENEDQKIMRIDVEFWGGLKPTTGVIYQSSGILTHYKNKIGLSKVKMIIKGYMEI